MAPPVWASQAIWGFSGRLALLRPSTNGEARQVLGHLGLDFDRRNVRVWRAFMAPLDQCAHGFTVTFCHHFHPPILKVAHPA
jgi:hypothetical protein